MKIGNLLKRTKETKECNLPFGSDECGKFLKETYKDSINETTLIKDDIYEKLTEYDEIVNNISKLESQKKVIEHILQNEMKNYEIGFCKERKITWKKVVKNTIDTKKLKIDNPELANNYIKTTSSRVFKIK